MTALAVAAEARAVWKKTKEKVSNFFRPIKQTAQTIKDIDNYTYDIAMDMKRSMDKAELLTIAKELENKARMLREIARTLDS